MELKQLEAFVAVVDYDSFSEAARHLFRRFRSLLAYSGIIKRFSRILSLK